MFAPITLALGLLLGATTAFAIPTAQRTNEIRTNEVKTDASGIFVGELIEIITIEEGGKKRGLKPICPHLNTSDHGCIRYVKGFDITGVVTEVDLTFPQIQSACDCIEACLNASTTCASWVYKFSTPESVQSGHRTCTLYSQFNLPADVVIVYDLNNSTNMNINAAEILANGNEPQKGSMVPQAFKDANLNTTADMDAVSGQVWQLSNGMTIC